MIFNDTKIAFQHLSNRQVLKAYWLFLLLSSRRLQKVIVPTIQFFGKIHLSFNFILSPLYNQFFGGKKLDDTIQNIRNTAKRHVFTILHYGVELKKTEAEFEYTLKKILESIEFAHEHLRVKIISCKVTGLGDAKILEKIQNKEVLTPNEEQAFERLKNRIQQICERASGYELSIYWDAEESWIQGIIDQLIENQMQQFNKTKALIYNSIQLYRTDRLAYLENLIDKAKQQGFIVGAKLVRGAYLEKENLRAKALNIVSPIHISKENTDDSYHKAIAICLNEIQQVSICIASHNEESCSFTINLMKELGIKNNHSHIWFSQLYGMSDHISNNLANLLYNVAKYMPYGKPKDALPYLIRRAEENSSSANMINREIAVLKAEIHRRSLMASLK